MIDFYTAPTPNGHKVSCTLEAMELEYETHVINLMEDEQNLNYTRCQISYIFFIVLLCSIQGEV